MKLVPWSTHGDKADLTESPLETLPVPDDALRLVIELRPDGSVNVTGPIMDKLRCYGMLQAAIQAVNSFTPAKVG